jgi:hypothetical protein
MVEQDLSQASESLEVASESVSTRELDEATHDPGTRVENIGSSEQSEAIEASITKIVDTSMTATGESGQKLEDSGTAKLTPQRLDKELDEARTKGKQMPDKDLENLGGMGGSDLLDDLMGDPFGGVGSDLDGGPGAGTHGDHPGSGPGSGPGPGSDFGEFGPGAPPKDLLDDFDKEMPKDTPGGPGVIDSSKGPMGQGMIMEGGDKGTKGQKGSDSGQKGGDSGQKGSDSGQKGTVTQGPAMVIDVRPGGADGPPVDAGHAVVDTETGEAKIWNVQDALQASLELIQMELSAKGIITPRPDDADSTITPPTEDEMKQIIQYRSGGYVGDVKIGGIYGNIDTSYSGDQVTDPAEGSGSGKLKDSGLMAGQELITDPPEDGAGKDAAETKG